jgi:hypothetical protein
MQQREERSPGHLLIAFGLAGLLFVLSACGSESMSDRGLAQFVKRGNALCARASHQLDELMKDPDGRRMVAGEQRIYTRLFSGFRKLDPPPIEQARMDRAMRFSRRILALLRIAEANDWDWPTDDHAIAYERAVINFSASLDGPSRSRLDLELC